VSRPTDIELMQQADGELDAEAAARVERAVEADARARGVIAGVRGLGDAVRGHLELAADEADPRLARMWGAVERSIAPPAKAGLWARFVGWLDDHRGHVMTGLLSAGAVAALMLWLRPGGGSSTVYLPEGQVDGTQPASLKRQAPRVESLDTPEGTSGNVFTIEGEGDEGTTTVIMVTPDDVEGT
jgi:hypothetical protein